MGRRGARGGLWRGAVPYVVNVPGSVLLKCVPYPSRLAYLGALTSTLTSTPTLGTLTPTLAYVYLGADEAWVLSHDFLSHCLRV